MVQPGGTLSLQKHHHRAEHWVVVRGTAEVTIGTEVKAVHENESIYIPIGAVHRLANRGKIPLELIEVQTGSYLGEDDIVRIEDVYRRPEILNPALVGQNDDKAALAPPAGPWHFGSMTVIVSLSAADFPPASRED